jgi:hypothetical protein
MVTRRVVGAAIAAGFVGFVVQAAAANQCPARDLGACARVHLQMMRPRPIEPAVPVAAPMPSVPRAGFMLRPERA